MKSAPTLMKLLNSNELTFIKEYPDVEACKVYDEILNCTAYVYYEYENNKYTLIKYVRITNE